jgi:hypothetical protein
MTLRSKEVTVSNPFAITTTTSVVRLDPEGHGEAVFTVSNETGAEIEGRVLLVPGDPAIEGWLSLAEEAERRFPAAGTAQYTARVAVPAGATPGRYSFRLDALDVQHPDEAYSEGPTVTFQVQPPEPPDGFPWWIIAVIAGVLVVGGVIAFLLWPRSLRMPTVAGLPLGQAEATLTVEGIPVGRTIEVPEAGTTPGYVVASTPKPGDVVTPGATVVLAVAAAATPTPTPTFTPTPTPVPVTVDLVAAADRFWWPQFTVCLVGQCPDFGHGDQLDVIARAVNLGGGGRNLPIFDAGMAAVRFDLSSIPPEATVDEAVLNLFLNSGQETGLQVYVLRATSPWSEDEGTKPTCTSDGRAVDSVGLTSGRYDWDITAIVQNQHANPTTNYGVCLELDKVGTRSFASREGPSSTRPRLTITYRP